jgi:hypothetical protein
MTTTPKSQGAAIDQSGAPALLQPAPKGERAAIESAIKFVETNIGPRRCDSPAVSDCWHCKTVYLASVLKRLLAAPAGDTQQASGDDTARQCTECGGAGVVDDGEIDCYPNGEPYMNGPVKCVKDCPTCNAPKGTKAAPSQALDARVAQQASGDEITYTVNGDVMRPLEYIAYLHDQLAQQAEDVGLWRALIADIEESPCEYPCLRDDLADWLHYNRHEL